jgi:hypothetical protein
MLLIGGYDRCLVDVEVRLANFKGSLQAIRSWEPQLNHDKLSNIEKRKMLDDLCGTVTGLPP